MTTKPDMSLFSALAILSRVHTRDDDDTGFVIMAGADARNPADWGPGSPQQYVEAWRVVRREIGRQFEPFLIEPAPRRSS